MHPQSVDVLRLLLRERRVAALGTLQDGEPAVSAVPFAASDDACSIVIHVSNLAAHTRNLQAHPAVSLMVMAEDDPRQMAQALPRLTLQGQARIVDPGDDAYGPSRALYLAKFADAVDLFGFADFRLVVIAVDEARLVAGFARAYTLGPDDLRRHAGRGAPADMAAARPRPDAATSREHRAPDGNQRALSPRNRS
jgi:putative heme iron utilization protein